MTRIWDLATIQDDEVPSDDSVMIISDGELTKKVSITNVKRILVPVASDTDLGKVRVGQGLEIDSDGTLSVTQSGEFSLPIASTHILGGVKVGENLTIDEMGLLDTKFPLTVATTTQQGVVSVGQNIDIDVNGSISVTFPDHTKFDDNGWTVGNSNDVTMIIDGGMRPLLRSTVNGEFNIAINDTRSTNNIVEISFINSTRASGFGSDLLPAWVPDQLGDKVNLGADRLRWNSVYATKLYGDLVGAASQADTLLVDNGSYRSATINATANTVAARDSAGALKASTFHGSLDGTATRANYLKVGTSYLTASWTGSSGNTIAVRDGNGVLYANRFSGIADKADYLKVGSSSYYTTATTATVNTIAVRDSSGNLTANYFNGTATQARFADLAEIYEPDCPYEVGTVVVFGGLKEITITTIKADHRVAGVVSGKPAYLMNSEASGLPVALRGKVPVKVIGKVWKGDLLICSAVPGYAMSVGDDKSYGVSIFAKSIEDKTDFEYGTVMAVIL